MPQNVQILPIKKEENSKSPIENNVEANNCKKLRKDSRIECKSTYFGERTSKVPKAGFSSLLSQRLCCFFLVSLLSVESVKFHSASKPQLCCYFELSPPRHHTSAQLYTKKARVSTEVKLLVNTVLNGWQKYRNIQINQKLYNIGSAMMCSDPECETHQAPWPQAQQFFSLNQTAVSSPRHIAALLGTSPLGSLKPSVLTRIGVIGYHRLSGHVRNHKSHVFSPAFSFALLNLSALQIHVVCLHIYASW